MGGFSLLYEINLKKQDDATLHPWVSKTLMPRMLTNKESMRDRRWRYDWVKIPRAVTSEKHPTRQEIFKGKIKRIEFNIALSMTCWAGCGGGKQWHGPAEDGPDAIGPAVVDRKK
ncbi:hypothetical protein Tco_0982695 [Tanacetum coccineum]